MGGCVTTTSSWEGHGWCIHGRTHTRALDHAGEAGALEVPATYVSDILLNSGVFFKKWPFPGIWI